MVSLGRDYHEKRDFIRMKINSAVTIRHQGNEFQGVCKDLSGAGLSIEIDQAFPVGEELAVYIPPQGESQPDFNASAKVSRCESSANGFLVGLSILQIND